MSTDDQKAEVTQKQDPQEFFQAIGDKVKNFSSPQNGDAAKDDDERPPVEEIESLCMNCGKNVSSAVLVVLTREA